MHVHLKPIDIAIARTEGNSQRLRLVEVCPQCRRALQTLHDWTLLADHPDPMVAAEIEMGHRRLDRLLSLPLEQALRLIRTDEEFHRWGLTRLTILAALHAALHDKDLDRAFKLVTLSLQLSAVLDPDLYGAGDCLRIGFQAIEACVRILATSRGGSELDRVIEASFLQIYTLLDSLFSPRTGPPSR